MFLNPTSNVPPHFFFFRLLLFSTFLVRGVILQSTFLSAVRVVFDSIPLDWLGDIFVNQSKIGYINKPVLFLHGKADDVVPFPHGEKLFHLHREKFPALRTSNTWIDHAGHNDIESSFTEPYLRSLTSFLSNIS